MIMFAFGTGTHSDQAVSVAAKSYTNGLSGIWYQWLWLPITPFYWIIAPIFRRFRAITTADVFKLRYGPSVAMLFTVVGIMCLMVNIGLMLKGSSAVISSSMGGWISPNYIIAATTVIFVVYGVAGGLSAAILTDFIQGLLTIIFSFLLLPLVMNAVGGMQGLREAMAGSEMLSLVAPAEIGFFYITVIALNALIGCAAQPHVMGICAAGKTEMEGRVGYMFGNLIKRFCTIPWCLTGLAAVVYFSGRDIDPDNVFGAVAGEFLPKIMPGILGVFLAAILASIMSSCDAFMIASSALFTQNVYKPLTPNKSEKHYLLIGRFVAFAVVAGGVSFAYWLPSVVKGLEIFWMISPMMGIAFWLGLFWRRTTTAGAWAATLASLVTWWLTTKTFFISFMANFPARFVIERSTGQEIYLPWKMIFYLGAGLTAGILVSLLTKPEDEERLDKYYELIRTPVVPGEKIPAPCVLPKDAVVPPKRNIFPNTNLEIPVPTLTSVIGFLVGWAFVAVIIAIVYSITEI